MSCVCVCVCVCVSHLVRRRSSNNQTVTLTLPARTRHQTWRQAEYIAEQAEQAAKVLASKAHSARRKPHRQPALGHGSPDELDNTHALVVQVDTRCLSLTCLVPLASFMCMYVYMHTHVFMYYMYVCITHTHTLSLFCSRSLSRALSRSLSRSLSLSLSRSLARSLSLSLALSLSQQARDARATKTHATKSKAVLPFASTPSSLPSYVSPLLNSPAGSASICIIHTLFIRAADDHASAGRRPGRSIYVYYCTAGPAKKLRVEVRGQVVLVVLVAQGVQQSCDNSGLAAEHADAADA